jgi:hypothetical protein
VSLCFDRQPEKWPRERSVAHHGISSRFGKKRADLSHLWLDPLIVAGPWLLARWLAAAKLKKLRQHGTS